MLVYLTHPKHGTHIVYDGAELQSHLKMGWSVQEEKKQEPVPVVLVRRRGRPMKVSN